MTNQWEFHIRNWTAMSLLKLREHSRSVRKKLNLRNQLPRRSGNDFLFKILMMKKFQMQFWFKFSVRKRRRTLLMLNQEAPIQIRLNSHQIKFCSWQIYRKKPMKWCYPCCLINFLVSRKFVWYQIDMILHLLSFPLNFRAVPLRKHCKDSKSHPHMQWK